MIQRADATEGPLAAAFGFCWQFVRPERSGVMNVTWKWSAEANELLPRIVPAFSSHSSTARTRQNGNPQRPKYRMAIQWTVFYA
jgi:hypothetical protein